ncbi:MAG: preprotein translocase subunit SecG [Clostridia bacterium]
MTSMLNDISMLLAPLFNVSLGVYNVIKIVLFVCMVLCAVFAIIVILFQPGNSQGVGAISGQSETFFGKNKSSSLEGKLKRMTVIALCVIIVFSILFFLVANGILFGVGAVVG